MSTDLTTAVATSTTFDLPGHTVEPPSVPSDRPVFGAATGG